VRDNKIISPEQWYDMLYSSDVLSLGAGVYYFMGREVVMGDNRVLLYDHCEYCGGYRLDQGRFCVSCGAPVLPEFAWGG
jgi:hypothetical protein